jgi:hypothetical protein
MHASSNHELDASRRDEPVSDPRQSPGLEALFDRFVALFNAATRRFGDLFPYHHLRAGLLRHLGPGAIEVVITSGGRAVRRIACVATGGLLVRIDDAQVRPSATWEVTLATLEDAASRPSLYLAHPERFAFGWFRSTSSTPACNPLLD